MPTDADRLRQDHGHSASKTPFDVANRDFQVIRPALQILHLNVEGFSAAKHGIIQAALQMMTLLHG